LQISNGNAWFCEVTLSFWLILLILRVQFDKNNQVRLIVSLYRLQASS
jgi:hypothetical protein